MTAAKEKAHDPPKKIQRILIVEDEAELLEFVERYLLDAGYDVISASDGMTGLQLAREAEPSLILLDVMLPKLNGFTISRLLKYDELYKHIPIILWTWLDEDEDRRMGIYAGADVYIPKPFSIGRLFESIVALIGPPPNTGLKPLFDVGDSPVDIPHTV